jgi:hypothetical protein
LAGENPCSRVERRSDDPATSRPSYRCITQKKMGIAPALAEVVSWATSDTRGLRIPDRGIHRFERCFLAPADVATERVVDFGLGPQSIGFSRPLPLRRKPGMSSLFRYAAKALRLLVRQRCPIDEVDLNALTGGGGDAPGRTPAVRTRYFLLNSSSIRER